MAGAVITADELAATALDRATEGATQPAAPPPGLERLPFLLADELTAGANPFVVGCLLIMYPQIVPPADGLSLQQLQQTAQLEGARTDFLMLMFDFNHLLVGVLQEMLAYCVLVQLHGDLGELPDDEVGELRDELDEALSELHGLLAELGGRPGEEADEDEGEEHHEE